MAEIAVKSELKAKNISGWFNYDKKVIELWVTGDIYSWDSDVIAWVKDAADEGFGLVSYVASQGGNALAALDIYNAIQLFFAGKETTCYIFSAMSAATIIASAHKNVFVSEAGTALIHNASNGTPEQIEYINQKLAAIYSKRGGKDEQFYRDLMKEEKLLTAAELIEIGLADGLIEDSTALSANAMGILQIQNSIKMSLLDKIKTPWTNKATEEAPATTEATETEAVTTETEAPAADAVAGLTAQVAELTALVNQLIVANNASVDALDAISKANVKNAVKDVAPTVNTVRMPVTNLLHETPKSVGKTPSQLREELGLK